MSTEVRPSNPKVQRWVTTWPYHLQPTFGSSGIDWTKVEVVPAAAYDHLQRELKDTEDEVQRLQRALAFWLPHVPPNDSPAAKRCGDDAFLLGGYEGPEETCAEELGWITMRGGPAVETSHVIAGPSGPPPSMPPSCLHAWTGGPNSVCAICGVSEGIPAEVRMPKPSTPDYKDADGWVWHEGPDGRPHWGARYYCSCNK